MQIKLHINCNFYPLKQLLGYFENLPYICYLQSVQLEIFLHIYT